MGSPSPMTSRALPPAWNRSRFCAALTVCRKPPDLKTLWTSSFCLTMMRSKITVASQRPGICSARIQRTAESYLKEGADATMATAIT
jgi:hypothetical protein